MKILAALFAVFIIVVIILADMGSLGFLRNLYDFPYGDKLGHFFLYGILSFLILISILRSQRIPNSKRLAIRSLLSLLLVIMTEEVSQLFLANRTFSLVDLFFSFTGALAGGYLARKFVLNIM